MKNLLPKLQQYITIIGVITAIGGGFYTWGQFNLRLDQIEAKTKKSVNLNPVKESVATLTTSGATSGVTSLASPETMFRASAIAFNVSFAFIN